MCGGGGGGVDSMRVKVSQVKSNSMESEIN